VILGGVSRNYLFGSALFSLQNTRMDYSTQTELPSNSRLASFVDHEAVLSTTWLAQKLEDPNVRIFDATWGLGMDPKIIYEGFEKERIPRAEYFNIDHIAERNTNLPHMFPLPILFEEHMRRWGINNEDHIIVYDRNANYVATARVWYTFKVFGHDRVSVLEGGFPKWKKENLPTESGPSTRTYQPGNFTGHFRQELVEPMSQMLVHTQGMNKQIVDARPAPRFQGIAAEPRPGLRSGHMPTSKNVPFMSVLKPITHGEEVYTFLPKAQLIKLFTEHGIDPSKPIVTTCGSGVTASVVALALHLAGNNHVSLYDGSWAEWGQPDSGGAVMTGSD